MNLTIEPQLAWGIFARSLGVILCVHFLSVLPQLLPLVGSKGLEPASWLFRAIKRDLGPVRRFSRFPSLFLINSSDWALVSVCVIGLLASFGIVLGGVATPVLFFTAWVCWLSIQVANPTVFSFPWDLLLTECAFFGSFLPPLAMLPELGTTTVPHAAVAFYFNWLLFRVVFGMGITRFRELGETEKDFTYIYHFLQWQPMPTPIAYYARLLPRIFHKLSFAFLFWAEVVSVFGIFGSAGSPVFRAVALVSIVLLQLGIWATGNYGTFSILTIALCVPLLTALPAWGEIFSLSGSSPVLVLALTIHFVASFPSFLLFNFWLNSLWVYQRKAMKEIAVGRALLPLADFLRVFTPFRLLNSYGVFCHQNVYVRDRLVMRLQGSVDGKEWKIYENLFLTSRNDKRPPLFAPYHPRLDHYLFYGLCEPHSLKFFMLMADNPYYFHSFCLTEKLVQKLLRNDRVALSFFRKNPFENEPPHFIRYAEYKYTFTSPEEKARTGEWWHSECIGVSEPISKEPMEEGVGIQPVYDPFISATQTLGDLDLREYRDPIAAKIVPMHRYPVMRFST